MKQKHLQIINISTIALLVELRLAGAGWVLMALLFPVIIPLFCLHGFATYKGFKNYLTLKKSEKGLLWGTYIAYIIFILFQFEFDDVGSALVIDIVIRKLFYNYKFNHYDLPLAYMYALLALGLQILGIDLYFMFRLRKKKEF